MKRGSLTNRSSEPWLVDEPRPRFVDEPQFVDEPRFVNTLRFIDKPRFVDELRFADEPRFVEENGLNYPVPLVIVLLSRARILRPCTRITSGQIFVTSEMTIELIESKNRNKNTQTKSN